MIIAQKEYTLYNSLAPLDDHSMGRHMPLAVYKTKFNASICILATANGLSKYSVEEHDVFWSIRADQVRANVADFVDFVSAHRLRYNDVSRSRSHQNDERNFTNISFTPHIWHWAWM